MLLDFACAASQFVYESISTTDWTEFFHAVVIMVMQLIYSIVLKDCKKYVYRFVCVHVHACVSVFGIESLCSSRNLCVLFQ